MTSRMPQLREKILKGINRQQRVILILGLLFTIYGGLRFFLAKPLAGYNLKTLLPTVSNGAEFILIGIGLLMGWYLTHKNKNDIVRAEEQEAAKRKKERKKSFNWGRRLK